MVHQIDSVVRPLPPRHSPSHYRAIVSELGFAMPHAKTPDFNFTYKRVVVDRKRIGKVYQGDVYRPIFSHDLVPRGKQIPRRVVYVGLAFRGGQAG